MYIFSVFGSCKGRSQTIFLVLLVALIEASSISAQTCLDDETSFQNLNCNANDVVIVEFTALNGITECDPGETILVDLQARLVAQASLRFDPGFFIAEDGGDALTGTCHHDFLPPPLSFVPTVGDDRFPPYFNAEVTADTCGDIEKAINTFRTIEDIPILCQDTDDDGFVDVGTCTTWDNQDSTGEINKPHCTSVDGTLPNTPSKCRCETVNTNITVNDTGRIIIQKETLGGDDTFTFDPSWNEPNFNLMNGQSHLSPPLDPGTYSVTETVPMGWENVSMACDDGSVASNITLSAGEVVTCTFINVFDSGQCVCDDGIECTIDFCDENDVCNSIPNNDFCSDGLFCNGIEACTSQGCVPGDPVNCSDAIECTNDNCDETLDECVNTPDDSFCSDDVFCNGNEICDPLHDCIAGIPPCNDPFECTEDLCDEETETCTFIPNDDACNDADSCTIDTCVEDVGCVFDRDESLPACKKRRKGGGSARGFVPDFFEPICPPLECLSFHNPGIIDNDGDGIIDTCDPNPFLPEIGLFDQDGDGIFDHCDNCPILPNPDQLDIDFDGIGDACDLPPPPVAVVVPVADDLITAASSAPKVEDSKSPSSPSCSNVNGQARDMSLMAFLCMLLVRLFALRRTANKVRRH